MAQEKSNYIAGIEVGTSKVAVVIGEVHYDGVINVIGLGSCPSKGIEKGNITDLNEVVNSIKRAISEAESVADVDIKRVTLAITGEHIKCFNEEGAVPVLNSDVSEEDVKEAMLVAQSIKLPEGLKIIHSVPQEYSLDKQANIKNPLGLQGVRLKAHAHIIACDKDFENNLKKAVEKNGIVVDETVFSGLASSAAVLTEDEKDLGVCLIDIGAGTMEMSVYTNGFLRATKVINYAGSVVTDDIACVFGAPRLDAENVKIEYGSAYHPPLTHPNKQIELRCIGGRTNKLLTKELLSQVISARYKELLGLAKKELDKLKLELSENKIKLDLIAGIVLTGGAAQIDDIELSASEVFASQVRVGKPISISGLVEYAGKPKYATVLGLLRHNNAHQFGDDSINNGKLHKKTFSLANYLKKMFKFVRKEF